MSYLLDTNVFIQAKNLHYGLDFCPAFWQWIIDNSANGHVVSIDKVADEIAAGADELTDWAKQQSNDLFRPTDTNVIAQLGEVSNWATNEQLYAPAAITTFFQSADFFLIGHALAGKHIVVTHEIAANSSKRIKIPNVCSGLGIHFMTPYTMLRTEKAKFVLEPKTPNS